MKGTVKEIENTSHSLWENICKNLSDMGFVPDYTENSKTQQKENKGINLKQTKDMNKYFIKKDNE